MNDTLSIVVALAGVAVATALPLYAYARLPLASLNQVFEHTRFAGLGAAENAGSPSGNLPIPGGRRWQGQPA